MKLDKEVAPTRVPGERLLHAPDVADINPDRDDVHHSTVTDFARFLGWSTSVPRATAM